MSVVPPALESIPLGLAWEPLPQELWDEAAARHLLNRVGYAASPEALAEAVRLGPGRTVQQAFAGQPAGLEIPGAEQRRAEILQLQQEARQTEEDQERRRLQARIRQVENAFLNEYLECALRRLALAEGAAVERWGYFLENIWVVQHVKVRDVDHLGGFREALRTRGGATYPDLCKHLSREPAMLHYLDLTRSNRDKPNENFARELFELFTLGEGNYTESDIKEAARAFTGYRIIRGEFQFVSRFHDDGPKTIFGQTGPWAGDDVIDLVFQQKAAQIFLPREMVRDYLTRQVLPEGALELLGALWESEGFSLERLRQRFFTSRMFYAQEFRGNRIRSPIELYAAGLQLLKLDVQPFPNKMRVMLRQAGQDPFNPPNVRGWLGATHWINASKLAGRRSLVGHLFEELDEEKLNADDLQRLQAARADGRGPFVLAEEHLEGLAARDVDEITGLFCQRFLAGEPGSSWRDALRQYFGPEVSTAVLRAALQTLMQTPEFQLS